MVVMGGGVGLEAEIAYLSRAVNYAGAGTGRACFNDCHKCGRG